MPRPAVVIENHPQHELILKWVAQGENAATVAAKLQPPIHRSTIWRYIRDKVRPAMQGPAAIVKELAVQGLLSESVTADRAVDAIRSATLQQISAEPILARIQQHQATADKFIAQAESGRDAAAMIGVDIKGMELSARLTGLLDGPQQSTGTVNNFFIAMSAPPAPAQPGPVVDALPSK